MPNHVTTVCTVTGDAESVAAFVARHIVKSDKGEDWFDFGTVIRKPACVDKTEAGTEAEAGFFALTGLHKVSFARFAETPMHRDAQRQYDPFPINPLSGPDEYLAWLKEKRPDAVAKGQAMLDCFRETGHLSWYDWNIANWGTKWGAYSFKARFSEPQKYVFEFQTAWSVPVKILQQLAALHAELTFETVSIDEGGPEYVGKFENHAESFEQVVPDAARYRFVYGKERPKYDDDGEEVASGGEAN